MKIEQWFWRKKHNGLAREKRPAKIFCIPFCLKKLLLHKIEANLLDRIKMTKNCLEKFSQRRTLFFEFDQNSQHPQTLTLPQLNMLVRSA